MVRSLSSRRLLGASLGALLSVLGVWACTAKKDPTPGGCSNTPHPSFYLVVHALDGRLLPPDTSIDVHFGSGQETFVLNAPSPTPTSVFCGVVNPGADVDAGGVDAGPSAGPAAQIVCSLWTDGAADVTVKAQGLATQERTLEAEIDDCDQITTSPQTIELTPPDGG